MSRNRGRKTREQKALETDPLTIKEREELFEALLKPPLAVSYAIIGALAVENELETSIRARLRRVSDEEWKAILADSDGPLGNFDRKIKFAGYLGILNEEIRHNFNIIRKVRNRFAHTKRLIDFNHPFIADELAKIKVPKRGKKNFEDAIAQSSTWHKYILLCVRCLGAVSKKRHKEHSAAYRAWQKRNNSRNAKTASSFGSLAKLYKLMAPQTGSQNPPPSIPISTLPHHPPRIAGDPSNPTPRGLLSGILPFLEEKDKQ